MTKVQIGLGAVFGDEHLTVLDRAHRARIHIQVGIQLEDRDVVPAGFQQSPQACGHDPLADAGDDTTGDEDEFGHDLPGDSLRYLSSPLASRAPGNDPFSPLAGCATSRRFFRGSAGAA